MRVTINFNHQYSFCFCFFFYPSAKYQQMLPAVGLKSVLQELGSFDRHLPGRAAHRRTRRRIFTVNYRIHTWIHI